MVQITERASTELRRLLTDPLLDRGKACDWWFYAALADSAFESDSFDLKSHQAAPASQRT